MNVTTRRLTHSAVMIALATALSLFAVYKLPNGGSVTFASMAPIILVSLTESFGWSFLTAFAYSLVQMLLGFYAPPAQTFGAFAAVILLDYVVAFSALSLAGPIARKIPGRVVGPVVASCIVVLVRLCCSFLSGILVWDVYAPEGVPVWAYSLGYNSSYMLPEMIVTAVAVGLIVRYVNLERLVVRQS